MSSAPRRSLGGAVVEDSLRGVGFASPASGARLVETQRPGRHAFTAVLAQNAWNVIPRADFERLALPYPSRMLTRMRLRRVVAHVNLRRARRVVCLSEAWPTSSAGQVCGTTGWSWRRVPRPGHDRAGG